MTNIQVIILSIVQGVTEFFPISSSGHLVVLEHFMSLPVEAMRSFDVSLHLGSFLSVVVYFWADYMGVIKESLDMLKEKNWGALLKSRIFYFFIGSIPAVIVGLLLNDIFDDNFRQIWVITLTMIGVAFYFLIAEKYKKTDGTLNLKKVILIGIAQAVAIIPGVSRSGATISTGILSGLKREEAAKFSFMLGSIAVFGAFLLTVIKEPLLSANLSLFHLILGVALSFFSSILSIHYLLKILKKYSLRVFAYYRFFVGAILIFMMFL